MRRVLAAATIAVAILASPALAMDDPEFSWGASAEIAAFNMDQDEAIGLSTPEDGFAGMAEFHGKVKAILDDPPGVEIGARASVVLYGHDASDLSTLAQPVENSIAVDDAYFYISTAFGELQIGERGGVADQMSLYAPSVLKGARVSDAKLYFLEDPTIPSNGNDFFRPIPLRTRVDSSQNNFKIVYLSPRVFGFQAGASYMHKPERAFSGFTDDADRLNRQSDIFEAGANFSSVLKTVHIAASIVYLSGSNEMPGLIGDGARYGFQDDIEEYGVGVNAAYDLMDGTLTIGASYRHSNAASGLVNFGGPVSSIVSDDIETEFWDAGAKYENGPWTLGASYIEGNTEALDSSGVDTFRSLDGRAWDVVASYTFTEGVQLAAGYQNWDYEQASPLPDFYDGRDSAGADVFFFELDLSH